MENPNLFTLTEASGTWGLHRYKDGVVALFNLYESSFHQTGTWSMMRPATEREIKVFEQYGKPYVAPVVEKPAGLADEAVAATLTSVLE